MNIVIMSLSLLISATISLLIFKKKNNKWLSLFTALMINTLILVGGSWILYHLDEEAKVFDFGHSGLYVLVFAIPIITWIDFVILQFVKNRG